MAENVLEQSLLNKICQFRKVYSKEQSTRENGIMVQLKQQLSASLNHVEETNRRLNILIEKQDLLICSVQAAKEEHEELQKLYEHALQKVEEAQKDIEIEKGHHRSELEKVKQEHAREIQEMKNTIKRQSEQQIQKIEQNYQKMLNKNIELQKRIQHIQKKALRETNNSKSEFDEDERKRNLFYDKLEYGNAELECSQEHKKPLVCCEIQKAMNSGCSNEEECSDRRLVPCITDETLIKSHLNMMF